MKPAAFEDLVTCLTNDQPPRVWSLLVTIFGDLAQTDGAQISGALLRQFAERIGYKPEALRVALHRLRKDGWIQSERHGRTSVHGLTDWGRGQSADASPLIYGEGPLAPHAWLVVFDPSVAQATGNGMGLWLTSSLLLTSQAPRDPSAFVAPVGASTPLPDWIRLKTCDATLAQAVRTLADRLSRLDAQGLARLEPLQRAVLRVLVVHDWRRIVLKLPRLPDHVFPQDVPIAPCRRAVTQVLQHLPPQDLAVLENIAAA
jgi:phenylacetic acid degradation operon negative regulatory protein